MLLYILCVFIVYSPGKTEDEDKLTPCLDLPTVFELSYYSNHVISVFLLESVVGR